MAIKTRIADMYQTHDAHRQQRKDIRRQGKEDRETAKQQADLELRNDIAKSLLQDENTRKAFIDEARETASFTRNAIKSLGIVLLIGGAVFVGYKVVKSVLAGKAQSDEQKQQGQHDKKNLSYTEGEYNSMANSLHNAMKNSTFWVRSISESTIISVLSKLKNKDDWGALVNAFGIRHDTIDDADYTLMDYLRLDGDSDQAKYQEILDKIGVYNVLN